MERSNSSPTSAAATPKAPSAPFAYQTRLLERTASRGGGASLGRNNSQSGIALLAQPTGSSPGPVSTRRWAPSHRVVQSLDTGNRRWDSSRDSPESQHILNSELKDTSTPRRSFQLSDPPVSFSSPESPQTPPYKITNGTSEHTTPTDLKRNSLPAPIIASPLSPNNTGISVEAISSSPATPTQRIRLPSSSSYLSAQDSQETEIKPYSLPQSTPSTPSPLTRTRRSNTLESTSLNRTTSSASPTPNPHRRDTVSASIFAQRRPTSMYGSYTKNLTSESQLVDTPTAPRNASVERFRSSSPFSSPSSPPASNSVMNPSVYRSSYLNSKKSYTYASDLGVGGGRLGHHLPRIASGDATDDVQADDTPIPQSSQNGHSTQDHVHRELSSSIQLTPNKMDIPLPSSIDDVAGVPGRLRLKAFSPPPTPLPSTPLPMSSRYSRGLWVDVQRHLLQAYEYLCHVGEAQQWIEGCLGEELGFGVVEMEEGLRNGVVLAKLVRVFKGEAAVPKIYEAQKLTFRHSDNINVFFTYVQEVGLPEGFVFELTDLYNKKNMPKVIYCIHALSHLLARRGIAQRIGNLLGQLQFSDDQLLRAQKGLKEANVPMPNFGNVGKELAKEINEPEPEPEPEPESEEERQTRLLMEVEPSIVALQAQCRGFLARKAVISRRGRIQLGKRIITKFQARCRGVLFRKRLEGIRRVQYTLVPWAIALQATARGYLLRRRWRSYLREIRSAVPVVVRLQSQIRGILQRRRYQKLKSALRTTQFSITKLQSIARARKARTTHKELAKTFSRPVTLFSVTALQAHCRGALARRLYEKRLRALVRRATAYTSLQSQCRAVLMRRRVRTQIAKLEDVTHVVVRIQAAVRTYLARKRLLALIRGLRSVTPVVVGFQSRARAILAQQQHQSVQKALTEVKTVASVGTFQSLVRAALVRNRHRELTRKFEFVDPDVIGLQATLRGVLVRSDYHAWRDHLRSNQHVATFLQAMLRGALVRRSFQAKLNYIRANLKKVIQIQSLLRGKETREQYRQLTIGNNVSVSTIKNFVHLLDDSEADFQEELTVERLRKQVVENIREMQSLENDISNLDIKIALMVQNAKTFDMIRARRHGDGAQGQAARMRLLAVHGDPFSNSLDAEARKKLELYQQLFYLLQTRPEYLCQLFVSLSSDTASEGSRRFTERAVLTLFGFGQDRREEYLLLKLFQSSIREEMKSAAYPSEVIHGHPMYLNIAVQYIRSKQTTYVRETLQGIIRELFGAGELDLEVDPSVIHHARIDLEEARAGQESSKPKQLPYKVALEDPSIKDIYIRHLQDLQHWTDKFMVVLRASTKIMPYSIRYLAREMLLHFQSRFPETSSEACMACVGRFLYDHCINPAIMAPAMLDMSVDSRNKPAHKNLAHVAHVLTQITKGFEFDDDEDAVYVPINSFVREGIQRMLTWFNEVVDIPDAETHFHAHEFLDVTVQPKPVYISPNEIYTIHGMLIKYQDVVVVEAKDELNIILGELDGVPQFNSGDDELRNARDAAITLELTNRFAHVEDHLAEEKTLWVQAKRTVLAILRVQPGKDLLESLTRHPTEEDESVWCEILDAEMENEQFRQHPPRQASAMAAESAYRLEDIREWTYAAVKAKALECLLELEKRGKISRDDGFQGILNAIANDVRSKHRKRLQRQQEMASMREALQRLADRKKYYEEQIDIYNDHVKAVTGKIQEVGRTKRRFVMPFGRQFFHQLNLQKSGQAMPEYGSFSYSAKKFYERGILLAIDRYSPRQFDKFSITISSDEPGVFQLTLDSTLPGVATRVAQGVVRMEDLLQAKFENQSSVTLLDGALKVRLESFIFQINKKFY